MFVDDEGQPVPTPALPGATVALPTEQVRAIHVDAAIDAAIADLMNGLPDHHGRASLVLHLDEDGQLRLGAVIGHRVSSSVRVAGYATFTPKGGATAGVEAHIDWAP